VGAVRLIEALIDYGLGAGFWAVAGLPSTVLGAWSWPRFIATQMWIFVLFLVWVTASEINHLISDSESYRAFFTQRSSALKSTRRARIRLLTQLSRLTDAYPMAVLEDVRSAPHRGLVQILRSLAHPP
jgi:hypothetical protein